MTDTASFWTLQRVTLVRALVAFVLIDMAVLMPMYLATPATFAVALVIASATVWAFRGVGSQVSPVDAASPWEPVLLMIAFGALALTLVGLVLVVMDVSRGVPMAGFVPLAAAVAGVGWWDLRMARKRAGVAAENGECG